MRPLVSGRSAVRLTCRSKSRSAKSLIAQPAERISTVPIVKIATSDHSGFPSDASHSATSVGQSRSRLPIGLSRRIRRK
jgi:hypothetical protein